MNWLIIIGTVLFLFAIISIIRRYIAQTLTSQLILSSQIPTNQVMNYAQTKLKTMFPNPQPISSTLIANVWGHGVMVFEFVFEELTITNQKEDKLKLEQVLNEYAKKNTLVGYQQLIAPFKVTDFWQANNGSNEWHIDVAYIINEVTLEYVHDIQKINNR